MKSKIIFAVCLLAICLVGCNKAGIPKADKEGFCIKKGVLYAYVGEASDIVIPDSVTEIASDALSGDTYSSTPRKVTVPGTVKKISENAFAFTSAKIIILEEGVETIESSAFMDSYIEEIHFPSSVKSIGAGIMETEEGLRGTKIYCKENSYAYKYFEENMPYGEAELIVEK